MMLSRMQRDCEYFLGYGNRSVTILSESDPQHHIDRMKELWKELPADGKPEWLTWEQLLNYEKELCNNNHNDYEGSSNQGGPSLAKEDDVL